MILRKPYAFLIKHFKLIHAILTVLMGYLVYKSYKIYTFYTAFINTGEKKAPLNSTDELFNIYMFGLPFLIILILIVALVILIRKKKQVLFYFINIIISIATIIIYNYLYSAILYMETNMMSAQEVNLGKDLSFIILLSEMVSIVIMFIRAAGLDLKKFDFGKDLLDLEINEEDNEEFEVDINVDTSILRRGYKKNLRYLRYFYKENEFFIKLGGLILTFIILFVVYINYSIYMQHYNQNEYFLTSGGTYNIYNTYVTSKDSKGNVVVDEDEKLMVMDISVTAPTTKSINFARTELHIGKTKYYPISDYANKLLDLGETYRHQELAVEETRYLLVYKIPASSIKETMYFKYINDFNISPNKITPNYIKVALSPIYLDGESSLLDVTLGEEISLKEKTLGQSTMSINAITLANDFKVNYKYCMSRKDCIDSVFYIKPKLDTNYDKALMKIEGSIKMDKTINNTRINNLNNLIKYFGKLVYYKDDVKYTINSFTRVRPAKLEEDNVYYLEIKREVLKSDRAYFIIKLRENEFRYTLKD